MAVHVQGRSISPPPSYDDVLRETYAATTCRANIAASTDHESALGFGSACDLPSEIISHILQFLGLSDRKDAALVCRKWYEASLHPIVQRYVLVSVKSAVVDPRPFTALQSRAGFHLELCGIDGSPNSEQLLRACESKLSCKLLTLSLKGSNVSQGVLVSMLQQCANLTSLDLSCCNSLALSGTDLGRRLNGLTLPLLEHLNLSSLRHLTDVTLIALLSIAPRLKSLSLCSAPFLFSSYLYTEVGGRPNSAALTFNRFLQELARLSSTFVSLNLSKTSISNGALLALGKLPNLRLHTTILASCKDLTDSGIIAFVIAQPNLTMLDLASNSQLSALCVKHIAAHLRLDHLNLTKIRLCADDTKFLAKFTSCSNLILSASLLHYIPITQTNFIRSWSPQMSSLDLSYCSGLSNALMVSICHHLTNLTHLNISSCFRLDDVTLCEISKSLLKLTSLNVGWCKHMTDLGLLGAYHPDFSHQCAELCRCSKDRQLTYFEHTPPVRDIAPKEALPNADHIKSALSLPSDVMRYPLSRLSRLTTLNLSVCSKITDQSICEVLCFPSLSSLDLSMCSRITDAAASAVAANNPLLEKVSFAQCRQITDNGVYSILVSCRRLAHLNVSGCSLVTNKTAGSIISLKPSLKTLDISLCNISTEAIDELERQLPCLQTIHKRYISVDMTGAQ